MTMYLSNNDVSPTGDEAGEFLDAPGLAGNARVAVSDERALDGSEDQRSRAGFAS